MQTDVHNNIQIIIFMMNAFLVTMLVSVASAMASALPEVAPAAVAVPATGVSPVDQAVADSSVHYSYGRDYG